METPERIPGKNAPEQPAKVPAQPEMPTRRGRPGMDVPEVPRQPEPEMPGRPPAGPESPGHGGMNEPAS